MTREQVLANIEYYKNIIKTQAGKIGTAQEAVNRAEELIKKFQKNLAKLDEPVVKHGDIIRDSSGTTAIVVGGFQGDGTSYCGKNGFISFYINQGREPSPNNAECLVKHCGYKVVGNIFER